MKKIRYNRYVELVESNTDKFILNNLITNDIYAVSKTAVEKIDEYIKEGKIESEAIKRDISQLYCSGFLIDDSISEEDEIAAMHAKIDSDSISPLGTVYFMPTLACNFRCVYCVIGTQIEKNQNKTCDRYMDDETIIQSAKYIVNEALEKGRKELKIILFGGEPSLAVKQNLLLMKTVNELVKAHNDALKVGYLMISNGYALNEKVIDELMENGLVHVQVTLDGNKETHDRRRFFINGSGTFEKIVENMKMLATKKLSIALRVNVDQDNCDSIEDLLRYIKEENLAERIGVQFAPTDPSDFSTNTGYTTEVLSKFDHYYEVAASCGISFWPWQRHCSLNDDGFYAIAPTGEIYKCPTCVGIEGLAVGSVYDKELKQMPERYRTVSDRCERCEYYPACKGGCLPMRDGANLPDFCFKEANSTIKKTFLKNKYGKSTVDIARDRLKEMVMQFY